MNLGIQNVPEEKPAVATRTWQDHEGNDDGRASE